MANAREMAVTFYCQRSDDIVVNLATSAGCIVAFVIGSTIPNLQPGERTRAVLAAAQGHGDNRNIVDIIEDLRACRA